MFIAGFIRHAVPLSAMNSNEFGLAFSHVLTKIPSTEYLYSHIAYQMEQDLTKYVRQDFP